MKPTEGVLSEAWDLYKAHWLHLVTISLIVYLVIAAFSLLAAGASVIEIIIATVISIVGAFWVQGALVAAVADLRDGRADLSIGQTFSSVAGKIPPIFIASILAGIGIGIGFVLLIVPGLILYTWWLLIIPAIVLENRGAIESFGRSRSLVRGYGWNVFGVVVLAYLILFVFGLVLGLVLTPLGDQVEVFLSNLISGTLTAPFLTLVYTLLYFRLRQAKEGTLPPSDPHGEPPPPPNL